MPNAQRRSINFFYPVSPQQKTEILSELVGGTGTNASHLAKTFSISPNTVRIHFKNINHKTGAESKTDLMQKFIASLTIEAKQ